MISVQLRDGPALNIDAHCNNLNQELLHVHPKTFLNDPAQLEIIRFELEEDKDIDKYHWAKQLFKTPWFGHMHMSHRIISPILHHLSTHTAYQKVCKEHFAEYDEVRCAFTLSYLRSHDKYDQILGKDFIYFDYSREDAPELRPLMMRANQIIMYIGLLIYLLKIDLG